MKTFFSNKTSSLKVWRLKSYCGRFRLGKMHLKLNPAYNVYWQYFSAEAYIRKSYLASDHWLTTLAAILIFLGAILAGFLPLKLALVRTFWWSMCTFFFRDHGSVNLIYIQFMAAVNVFCLTCCIPVVNLRSMCFSVFLSYNFALKLLMYLLSELRVLYCSGKFRILKSEQIS